MLIMGIEASRGVLAKCFTLDAFLTELLAEASVFTFDASIFMALLVEVRKYRDDDDADQTDKEPGKNQPNALRPLLLAMAAAIAPVIPMTIN